MLDIAAAIYQNGEETQVMCSSSEMAIGGKSDKMFFGLIFRLKEGFGIADWHSQLKIVRSRVTISVKAFRVTLTGLFSRLFELIPKNSGMQLLSK